MSTKLFSIYFFNFKIFNLQINTDMNQRHYSLIMVARWACYPLK